MIKIIKLNLIPKNFKDSDLEFLGMFGISKNALKDLPEEEIVWVDPDKVLGISQKMKTGIEGDDRFYCKLYFNSKDYWTIKWLDDYENGLLNEG